MDWFAGWNGEAWTELFMYQARCKGKAVNLSKHEQALCYCCLCIEDQMVASVRAESKYYEPLSGRMHHLLRSNPAHTMNLERKQGSRPYEQLIKMQRMHFRVQWNNQHKKTVRK